LHRAEAETGTVARLIVCGLRTLAPAISYDLSLLAVDYKDAGVIAFDLAGAERGFPARAHARAFEHAHQHGLACTCHAGEGDGPASIRQALDVCHAQRIGHGTRLREDPDLEAYVVEQRVPLEVCVTSNVHTRTVESAAEHPLRRYLELGCVVTLNTDSRLMDGITLSDEYWLVHTDLGLEREDIERLILNGFESAFLADAERAALVERIQRELRETA
jgi:adenosine deaminase